MTPKRKTALQWFYDRGEICLAEWHPDRPNRAMVTRMLNSGEVAERIGSHPGMILQGLTDYGRQRLHEAG